MDSSSPDTSANPCTSAVLDSAASGSATAPAPSTSASTSGSSSFSASAEIKLMGLNDSKAGMAGLDVESINRKIQEASKGSKFYLHKKAVQEKLDRKVQQMKEQAKRYSPSQLKSAEKEVSLGCKLQYVLRTLVL